MMGFGVAATSVVAMLTMAILGRLTQGSWLAPAPVAAILWAFVAGLPLVIAPDYPFRASGYAYLGIAVVVSTLTGIVATHFARRTSRNGAGAHTGRWRRVLTGRSTYTLALIAAFGAPIALYLSAVNSFGITSLPSLAAAVTRARYETGASDPLAVRALIASVYASAALGGWNRGVGRISLPRSVLWLLPMLGVVSINTGRSGLVLSGVLWIAFWIAGRRTARRPALPSAFRLTAIGVGAFTALFGLFFATQFLRIGEVDAERIASVYDRSRVYFAGGAPAFAVWFDAEAGRTRTWGTATFASIADAVDLGARDRGKYTRPVELSEGQTGNIYTVFRPLIEDFGVVGSLVVWSILAILAGSAWGRRRTTGSGSAGPLAVYYAVILFSPVTTIFQWTSSTLVLLVLPLVLAPPPAQGASLGTPTLARDATAQRMEARS